MILAFEDSISKLLDIDCGANIEAQERVDDSLVEILKLKFGCHECSSLLEAGIVDDLFHDFDDVIHIVVDAVFDDEFNANVKNELIYVNEFVADIFVDVHFDVEVNIRVPKSSLRSTQCSLGPLCLWQC